MYKYISPNILRHVISEVKKLDKHVQVHDKYLIQKKKKVKRVEHMYKCVIFFISSIFRVRLFICLNLKIKD